MVDFNMFNGLLLNISQLYTNLFIVLHSSELLGKCLFQLFKCAIWMVLNKVFTPFKDIIFESKNQTNR